MSSAAGSSRFLAYLEQRRSLTASQSTGIAKQLRDYEAGKADMQQASISRTQPSTPTAAAMASAPHSITPLLLRSQSLTAVSLPSAAYTTGCAPSPIDTADEEHKETIISSSSTVSTASSSASSDLSPLAPLAATLPSSTPSSLSSAYPLAPASSLLHRELVDLRLRLQRTEDEHMTERKRWEQQRAAERREAEEWKRRAEEKREREEEWEDERGRLRAERDEWSSERLVMQQELDRLNVYFQQLSSTSPTAAASSSSSLSSALSIVAVAKDREENNRLRRKNNRLIDTVNQKQTECDTLLTQLAQLTQWKQQHEQQSTEHTKERTRLQQQHEQLTSEVARLRRAESEWQQRQAEKKELERLRLQFAEKESKYKQREEEYKQSIERLTRLAADRKNVNNELDWTREHISKLEDRQQQLTAQCTQVKERADEAERKAEEQRVECGRWKDKCVSVGKELEGVRQQRELLGSQGNAADNEWAKNGSERLQMEERLSKLEHERAILEQLLRKERQTTSAASPSNSMKAAALHALDAFVPVASPVSSTSAAAASPSNRSASSSETASFVRPLPSPSKRDVRPSLQHAASLPTSVGSSPSSSTSSFLERRASLPGSQKLTHSTTQPLPSLAVHRSALKAPLKAVHPGPIQLPTDLPPSPHMLSSASSSPRSASPSSLSLTASGGSVHRVRFASPLTVTADEGVLTTRDDNSLKDRREQQPDTPTRSRLKQLVLGFF